MTTLPSSPSSRHHITQRTHSWLATIALLLLASCSAVPDSGPTESIVLHTARNPQKNPLSYSVKSITPDVANILASEIPPIISTLDTRENGPVHSDRINPGDLLNITIFELGNGLFSSGSSFSPEQQTTGVGAADVGTTGVTAQELPPTEVAADGTISLPYLGRLQVAHKTPGTVSEQISRLLAGKSQNPEVMVSIAADIGNTVVVSGEVHTPGRVLLSAAEERLSDLIAIAGGAIYPPKDTVVQLIRRDQMATTDLATLEAYSSEDIKVHPGDRVHVIYQPRTYSVFGASGETAQEIPFDTPQLSLAQALARAGGPADERADPNGTFLFRFETPQTAQKLGLTGPKTPLGIPVVYQLDMMNPTSYFLSQKIPMKSHDVLLVANAKTNRFYKFDQIISTLVSPAVTSARVAR